MATTYKDIPRAPGELLRAMQHSWSFRIDASRTEEAVVGVVASSVGRGAEAVDPEILKAILRIAAPTYARAADWVRGVG